MNSAIGMPALAAISVLISTKGMPSATAAILPRVDLAAPRRPIKQMRPARAEVVGVSRCITWSRVAASSASKCAATSLLPSAAMSVSADIFNGKRYPLQQPDGYIPRARLKLGQVAQRDSLDVRQLPARDALDFAHFANTDRDLTLQFRNTCVFGQYRCCRGSIRLHVIAAIPAHGVAQSGSGPANRISDGRQRGLGTTPALRSALFCPRTRHRPATCQHLPAPASRNATLSLRPSATWRSTNHRAAF